VSDPADGALLIELSAVYIGDWLGSLAGLMAEWGQARRISSRVSEFWIG
jgi:hypothetical protein